MNFDCDAYRGMFPITKKCTYVNHAGTGPLSSPARQAIEMCLDIYAARAEFPIERYFEHVRACRASVARFVGANLEEITFTHSTSQGLYIALTNCRLDPGDTVLVMEGVFPAARYAVDHNLPGIQKRYVRFSGQDPVEVVEESCDSTVKAVVVDLVHYLSGERIDIKRLSAFLKERGIISIVDGIQAIGAIDFVTHETDIDFLACGAAKWLFGPSGTGFLYVNKRQFPHTRRLHTGWLGAQWTGFEHCDAPPPLYDDARMFEQGTRNIIGISALAANCDMLMNIGMDVVDTRIQMLTERLRTALRAHNYELLTPGRSLCSGIITARPDENAAVVYERLTRNAIVLSLRSGWLRFSPHFYNTEEEIDRIAALL
ncbi:aminotransferase class V-fold PLP-dependent enzyme [candidate division WOR-3 bacterium]|nr:aminotransferase class V-fold PLP-dependent enzyme [candidate division WOR-3 bacterium]